MITKYKVVQAEDWQPQLAAEEFAKKLETAIAEGWQWCQDMTATSMVQRSNSGSKIVYSILVVRYEQ